MMYHYYRWVYRIYACGCIIEHFQNEASHFSLINLMSCLRWQNISTSKGNKFLVLNHGPVFSDLADNFVALNSRWHRRDVTVVRDG